MVPRPGRRMPYSAPRIMSSDRRRALPALLGSALVVTLLQPAVATAVATTATSVDDGSTYQPVQARLYPGTRRQSFRPAPGMSRPGYRSWSRDRTYGTRVMRISDEAGVRHRYSSKAAWNANGSLLLLDYKSGSREVRNGRTFAILQRNVGTGSYFAWSNRRPYVGYSAGSDDAPRILRYRISRRGAFDVAHTSNMTSIAGWSEMSFGGGHGSPSNGDLMAVAFKRRNGDWGVAVVDLKRTPARVVSQRVFGRTSGSIDSQIDNVGISQTGKWVNIAFNGDGRGERQGVWLYRRNLATRGRVQVLRQEEHWDWARARSGRDVYVYRAGSNDVPDPGVWAYDTGRRREYPLVRGMASSVHISGRNIRRPGWVFVASSSRGSGAGYGTIFAVNLARPSQIQAYAHSHHERDMGYESEVHASASPNGRWVVFASEWGGSQIHAYVAGR